MPRKPPAPKPSPTKKSTATAKKSTTRRTGPSADAMAGAASAKRKVASKATDAVSRRYESTEKEWNGSGGKKVLDKVTGISREKYSDNASSKNPIYYSVNDKKTEKKYLGKTVNAGKSKAKAQKILKNSYGK